MRVLQLKAARGRSYEQAAAIFAVDEQTLKSWLRRVDEEGESALVQLSEPVNRFPDFVRYLVRQLKALCPTMGKVRIAQVLARAGLHLGATTVGRILKETEPIPEDVACTIAIGTRSVKASYPGELWHVDLTAVPTGAGFWVPWLPYSLPQSWPFCWGLLSLWITPHALWSDSRCTEYQRDAGSNQRGNPQGWSPAEVHHH